MGIKDDFVGVTLSGFCGGYFGSSSYGDKLIIANGDNWVVTYNEREGKRFASFPSREQMIEIIEEYSEEDKFEGGNKDDFVGVTLYGFCNGYFGRDSFRDKVVVSSGSNWIVANEEYGDLCFAEFATFKDMEKLVKEWSSEEAN